MSFLKFKELMEKVIISYPEKKSLIERIFYILSKLMRQFVELYHDKNDS